MITRSSAAVVVLFGPGNLRAGSYGENEEGTCGRTLEAAATSGEQQVTPADLYPT